jgi:PAS domain S-box-containing protein
VLSFDRFTQLLEGRCRYYSKPDFRLIMERVDLHQWKTREVARLLALVETERRYYQEIVASIPIGLLVISADLAIVSANRAILTIFGLRSKDSLRGPLDTLLPALVLDRVTEALKTGGAEMNILAATLRSGKRIRLAIQTIRGQDDEASKEALLTIEDLSGIDSTPQGQALASERHQFPPSEILDKIDAMIWAAEVPSMRFVFVSKGSEKMLGYAVDQWTSNDSAWTDRVYQADRELVVQSYRHAIDRGEGQTCEYRALTGDGQLVWLRESADLLKDVAGNPTLLIGVTVEITQRRELEEQLVQAERIDAVVRFGSRMGHELNRILMIQTCYGEELLNELPVGSPLRGYVEEILQQGELINGLTSRVLAFSTRPSGEPGRVSLEPVLIGLKKRLRYLTEGLQLDFEIASDLGHVKADAALLAKVLTVIVEHARLAMQGKGWITIEASRIQITEETGTRDAPLHTGAYAVISITTTGPSLERDTQTTLFETVLAGNEAGDEVAAAMSRVYRIVRQWGGDISVSNGPIEGFIFRVFLESVAENDLDQSKPPNVVHDVVAPVAEMRAETILVVEDEAGIRALMRRILRRKGYQVLEASNGEDALIVCREHPSPIDLLIFDVMILQIGGSDLIARLREQYEGIKILISGYTDDSSSASGNFPTGSEFLQKPFTSGSLVDKVKDVLADEGASGSHASDDELERYSLGKVSEDECLPLEEHLLLCARCRARLEEIDSYIAIMKAAQRAILSRPD